MRSILVPRVVVAAFVLVASAGVVSPAAAQLEPGSTLIFSGFADASELGSEGVLLDFGGQVTADPTANGGTFATLNTTGHGAVGTMRAMTVGKGPQPIRRVLHLGPYEFDLAFLPSGQYGQDDCYVAPAVGQHCTPYQLPSYELSPFYLENAAHGGSNALFTATVKFDVAGTVSSGGRMSDFSGTLSAVFEGLSYQEALAGLERYGMLEDIPFTGTFVAGAATVTPEPATAVLTAIGLGGIMLVVRRRRS